jgi:hypothetical protein
MSIPKKIHYIWFSESTKKPDNIIKCLESWKHILNDYEIIEWNEKNLSYNDFIWTQEAFLLKKWAFVSDFFRLWILKQYGGIYLDTDVFVLKNFDKYLEEKMFIGTGSNGELAPYVFGAEPNHPFISKCLEYYLNRRFVINGKTDEMVNNAIMTKMFMVEHDFYGKLMSFENEPLKLKDISIYNPTYFSINIYNGLNVCYHNFYTMWSDDYKYETERLSNNIRSYFIKKYFCYDLFHENSNKSIVRKILQTLTSIFPGFFVTLILNYELKLKNHKRFKKIKIFTN